MTFIMKRTGQRSFCLPFVPPLFSFYYTVVIFKIKALSILPAQFLTFSIFILLFIFKLLCFSFYSPLHTHSICLHIFHYWAMLFISFLYAIFFFTPVFPFKQFCCTSIIVLIWPYFLKQKKTGIMVLILFSLHNYLTLLVTFS